MPNPTMNDDPGERSAGPGQGAGATRGSPSEKTHASTPPHPGVSYAWEDLRGAFPKGHGGTEPTLRGEIMCVVHG